MSRYRVEERNELDQVLDGIDYDDRARALETFGSMLAGQYPTDKRTSRIVVLGPDRGRWSL